MKTNRMRRNRGQAAVELALLSILIIPVFLYIIFLDDLLRFKLDQEEAMVTSGWDFSTINYDHQTNPSSDYIPSGGGPIVGKVQGFARYQFSDHLSSSPRFDDPTGNNEKHHLGVGAHQCWLVGGGNQVTCTQPDINAAANFGFDATLGARTAVRDFLANGNAGIQLCKGNVGVINHWLPSGTLFFSKEELSSRKYYGKNSSNSIGDGANGVHGAYGETSVYLFPEDGFSVIANPWAMANQDNFNEAPPSNMSHSGPLYDRVNKVYNATGPMGMVLAAQIYPIQAIAKSLISPLVIIDSPLGDYMGTPEVSFTNAYDPKVNGFYSSQYWDFNSNPVAKTYQKRGTWYLGSKTRP